MLSYSTIFSADVIFTTIGALYLGKVLFQLTRFLTQNLLLAPKLSEKYGENGWAVITGATDGIGKGFARQLAVQGYNICLIARNVSKAQKVINEELLVLNKHIKTAIVEADFKHSLENYYIENISHEVRNLLGTQRLAILINNVGVVREGPFEDISQEFLHDIIAINCASYALLTKHLLDKLIQSAKNNTQRSAIINVSSFASEINVPLNATYTATKAFEDFFSRALWSEFLASQKTKYIDVLSFRPMWVKTAMTKYVDNALSITPDACAKGCLKQLAWGAQLTTHGHFWHQIQSVLTTVFTPQFITDYFSYKVMLADLKKQKKQE